MGKRDRTPDAAIDGGWLSTRAEERRQYRIYGCCIGDGPGGQLLREGLFEERGVHVRRNASLRLCDHGIRVYVGLPERRLFDRCQVLAYGQLDEVHICVKAEIFHDPVFVKGHGPGSQIQHLGCLPHCASIGE
jgi:hypothetical protein